MLKKYLKFIDLLKLKSINFYSSLLAVVSFLNYSLPAQASTDDLYNQMDAAGVKAWGSKPMAGSTGLPDIIQYIISTFLSLLGIIFLVLIIYSGFNWMTARGDEDKVTLAKSTLTRAVIGLIIIIAAYSITYFVFSNLPDGGSGGGSQAL